VEQNAGRSAENAAGSRPRVVEVAREVNAMNHKMPKPPTTERRFGNTWGELAYLCRKIRYWLYIRKQRARADHYRNRLAMVLHDLPENDLAIIREEGLALYCEMEDEVGEAIAHREREIQLIERLHREAESPRYDERTRAYMLQNFDTTALQERRVILESLRKAKALQQRAVIHGRR
jgi:hypothetical protein